MKKQPIAYSYIRFSTPDQARGDSMRRQAKATKDWCETYGYRLAETVFNDKGKSAFKGDNFKSKAELNRFLSLVEDGTLTTPCVLLIENFDRFSRLPASESLGLFLKLVHSGIGVAFTGAYDKRPITKELLKKEQYALMYVLNEAMRSHQESARKSETVSAGIKARNDAIGRGSIRKHNNAPKFFTWDTENNCYKHTSRTAIVKEIVNSYLAGNSIYSITKNLNIRKVPSVKEKKQWSAKTLRTILSSRYLFGEFLGNPHFFPPITTKDVFERIQVLLARNSKATGKSGRCVNIFKTIARCSECDASMNMIVKYMDPRSKKVFDKPYRYLRCPSRSTGKICSNLRMYPLGIIEEEFFGVFMKKNPKDLIGKDASAETKRIRVLMTKSQAKLDTTSKRIANLVKMDDALGIPEVIAALQKENTLRATVKAECDQLALKLKESQLSVGHFDNIQKLFANIDKDMKGFDDAMRRMEIALQDNTLRKTLKTELPLMVGSIKVDTERQQFEVFNRSGNSIYKSMFFVS